MGAIRGTVIATKASIIKQGVLCTGVHSWLVSKSRLCVAEANTKTENQMVRNRQAKTDRQTDRQTGRQAGRQAGRQTETDRQTNRQTDRQAGRQTDRQTDRQKVRQTDI